MISWKPSLSIGVPEIDAQHQALFEKAACFEAAVKAREPNHRLAELFGFLSRYATVHLGAEERLLRETRYPGLPEHVRQHADFQRRLGALVPHWESEGASTALLLALVGFLDLWLRDHVTSSDQRIGDYLRARAHP
jgi:hemerythrin-like metal-binding protein